MGGSNFAQFIVNTTGDKDTEALLDELTNERDESGACSSHHERGGRSPKGQLTPRYKAAFPEAVIRFKQLGYSQATNPIEVRLSGDDLTDLKKEAERVEALMRSMPELGIVRTNCNEPLAATRVTLDEHQSTRPGITNAQIETALAMRYGSGVGVGTVWESGYDINVVLKSTHADSATTADLLGERIAVGGGLATVPLRQVAGVTPSWEHGQTVRRNGVRTVTVMAETARGINAMAATSKLQALLDGHKVADGVTLKYGGELEENEEQMPDIMGGLLIATVIIYFILVARFKRVATATLLVACLSLSLTGTALGVLIQGVDFGVTGVLGIVSLMGILVRNGIIMTDYAEELRRDEHLHVRDAIFHSAKRRMRPIFLTSAAASMGVIPMIPGGSGLWMPMGTVIFYGTLITMIFILTVIPVAYWKMLAGTTRRRAVSQLLEQQ